MDVAALAKPFAAIAVTDSANRYIGSSNGSTKAVIRPEDLLKPFKSDSD